MDCYTGPYWSNGKFQSSVEFGDCVPIDRVDYESRLHDTAFARYGDTRHRTAADWIYQQRLAKVPGIKSALVRNLPLYGNYLGADKISGLFGPLSLLNAVSSLYDIYDLDNQFKQGKYDSEIADVMKLYQEDPLNMGNITAPMAYPDQFEKGGPKIRRNRILPDSTVQPTKTNTFGVDITPSQVSPTNIVEVGLESDGTVGSVGQVSSTPPPVSLADLANTVSVLGRDNLSIMETREPEGTRISGLAFNPYSLYKPLKKKKNRKTQKDVDMYNKYHGTHYSLREAQTSGLYF